MIISDVRKIYRVNQKFHTDTFVITFLPKRINDSDMEILELHFAIHTASLSLSDLIII